jgi:hypothetical protein
MAFCVKYVARVWRLYAKLCTDNRNKQDQETLAGLCKTLFSLTLETKEISFKGWNWGSADFRGKWPFCDA